MSGKQYLGLNDGIIFTFFFIKGSIGKRGDGVKGKLTGRDLMLMSTGAESLLQSQQLVMVEV